jgi:hypothetical protein
MLERLNNNYTYERLTEDEIKKRGILGRLVGNVADFLNPTRNGRMYNETLWEKVFDNPIMKEKFKNKVMYGELGHPADRTETDMEKVAVCMAEPPKKDKDGTLKAVFDILPTPNGKILKALCDYGSTLGVSSRGTGEVLTDEDGNDYVDPETYDCECFDIVLVPAVESARLQYVSESLKNGKKDTLNLTRALNESLNASSEEDKKIMTETLNNLGINLSEEEGAETQNALDESLADTKAESNSSEQTIEADEANNDGSDELIKSLQDALKESASLKKQVKELQEKLAVSDAESNRLNEELGKYKKAVTRLTVAAKEKRTLESKVSTLEEELKVKTQTIETKDGLIATLTEKVEAGNTSSAGLNESLTGKDREILSLKESIANKDREHAAEIARLTEELNAVKSDSESKEKELSESLAKAKRSASGWKKLSTETVARYISSKAVMYGVTENDIKNRLPESYTLDDIDAVCEDLLDYELNMTKIPFNFDRKVKVKIRESVKEPMARAHNDDDDIDSTLLGIAKIKN